MTTPSLDELIAHSVGFLELSVSAEEAANRTLAELGIDSLELINLSMDIEERYGLELDLDKVSKNDLVGWKPEDGALTLRAVMQSMLTDTPD